MGVGVGEQGYKIILSKSDLIFRMERSSPGGGNVNNRGKWVGKGTSLIAT